MFAPSCGILRQVIGDLIPRRTIIYERVILRADARIIVERSHPDGDLIALRPIATKQARAAIDTKCFYCALSFSVNAD